jgi:WhiB family transcriptional regulator, redox-sensing transcriptional regulator
MSIVLNWRASAACRGTDPGLFFARDGETASLRFRREEQARKVCVGCPVRVACLRFQLGFEDQADDGIFAGFTGLQRQAMRHAMLKRSGSWRDRWLTNVIAASSGLKVCAGPCGKARPAEEFRPRQQGGYKYTACEACRTSEEVA